MVYLHVDPQRDEDIQVLRFLRKEWPTIKTTLHTTQTMEKLKHILLVDMQIPYLRRVKTRDPYSLQAKKWEYWNDYTPEGIRQFEEEGTRKATVSPAPAVLLGGQEDTTLQNEEKKSDRESVDSDNTEESGTSESGEIMQEDENSNYRNPIKLLASSQDDTMPETSQPLLEQQHTAKKTDSRVADVADAPLDTLPFSPTNRKGNRVKTEVTIPTNVRDPDGDTIVDVEATEAKNQRRRQETYEMSVIHRHSIAAQRETGDEAPDLSTMLRRFEDILKSRTHDAVKALDTRQKVWEQTILQLQSQVQTQERLLQARKALHDQRVLKAEATLSEWETMLTAHEERLEAKEDEMTE